MLIEHNSLHIPTNYMEDNSYDSIQVVTPHYGARTRRATNKFRQGMRIC